jgi:transposase-like protein
MSTTEQRALRHVASLSSYLSDPARTYASVARDLGINRETLRLWVRAPAHGFFDTRFGGARLWVG